MYVRPSIKFNCCVSFASQIHFFSNRLPFFNCQKSHLDVNLTHLHIVPPLPNDISPLRSQASCAKLHMSMFQYLYSQSLDRTATSSILDLLDKVLVHTISSLFSFEFPPCLVNTRSHSCSHSDFEPSSPTTCVAPVISTGTSHHDILVHVSTSSTCL